MSQEEDKPYFNKRFDKWEISLPGDADRVIINCCANQTIEVDKLFGPLSAFGVRIRLEYDGDTSDWVVEREKLVDGGSEWIEMARWDCQMDWRAKDDEDDQR